MTSGPWFRPAQEADADLILEFMREYYCFRRPHFDEQSFPAALIGLLRADSLGCIWLIRDGDVRASNSQVNGVDAKGARHLPRML